MGIDMGIIFNGCGVWTVAYIPRRGSTAIGFSGLRYNLEWISCQIL